MPILVIAAHIIGLFGLAKAQILQQEKALVSACSNFDAKKTTDLLLNNANPNLGNPLGVTLRAILDQHKRTEPSGQTPAQPTIPEFPQSKSIEKILDALIAHGVNPLIHKLENIQLLNELISAYEATHYISIQNPIIIALLKLLPMFLTYEVAIEFVQPSTKGMKVYGDINLVITYLKSIENLYNKFPKRFDPLNTPLVEKGEGLLGKTPVQLAAENGHAGCLSAMLALKDTSGYSRVNFTTAYTALKNANSEQKGFFRKTKSCKKILEEFLHTHFSFNKEYNKNIIQTAQSIVARTAWQQKPETYDSAITNAINKYAEKRFVSN